MVVDEAEFDLDRWYGILERERIAGLVHRAHRDPHDDAGGRRGGGCGARLLGAAVPRLVGEPLNAECVIWGERVFGKPFHDNWWQSETGGIMIANTADMDIKPGAMGKPLPGIAAGIVARDGDTVRTCRRPIGELALRPGWPSMMRAYLGQPERYAKALRAAGT
jgi:acetyl-CoA synthetase